jgi:GTPase SAR1 family protein
MEELARRPTYMHRLRDLLKGYPNKRWTRTEKPCWDDLYANRIVLPEDIIKKILKHLETNSCAIIGLKNTGKTWLCYGVGVNLEKNDQSVWYIDRNDFEVDPILEYVKDYINKPEEICYLIVEDCHRNTEETKRLLAESKHIGKGNLRILFTTEETEGDIPSDVDKIKLPDDLLTSGEDYAKTIIEKFLEIEKLRVDLDIKDLENSAKIGCKDLSQLSECLNEWVEKVRKVGFGKAVKLADIIKEKEDKKKKLSDKAKDVIREIKLEPLIKLISSASQEKINDFYSGEAPSPGTPSAWGVIAAGAVKRDLEDKIEQVLQENDNFHIICIVAEPGAGKTTLAMKVLYGLSQRGEQAFWLQDRCAEFWFKLSELTEHINNRLYIFIDNIFRDIDFVEALQDINKGNLPVTIIATSRTNEYKDRNLKEFIKKIELKVSEKEKKELLERIGKSYVDLSPDERKDFNETNLFIVLGMVLSKGNGFSEIIKDIVEKLKVQDEALYRAYEYVCFSSNYDISIPEDLLRNLDKQGRFYGLVDEKSERGILVKGIFYEDSVPSYPTKFIKAGHQLIAKEALRYYSRYPKVLFEEILEAADEENWVNRRYITHLIRAILVEGQGISKEDVKNVITKSEKIDHIRQYASISELNWWKLIYKQLNLQEEVEKCAEGIRLQAPNTSWECQLLVSELLNKGFEDRAFSTIKVWLEEYPDKTIFTRYLSLVKDKGSQEQIEALIEETCLWLKDHPEDNKVRVSYLTTCLWLKDHPEDYTVRVSHLTLVKDKGSQEQIEALIEETRLWLKDHPEDNEVRKVWLVLIRDKGDQEQIRRGIEGTILWLKDHPDDNTVREAWLVLIRDKGNQEQIRRGIEGTILWLKDHPEANEIRSVYLFLVREKAFFKEDIKLALDDGEQYMKKYGSHFLFRDYLPLVDKIRKTKIDVGINVELIKQFGYEFINSCKWKHNIRPIKNFADWLRREKIFGEAEQIYERLIKEKMRNLERSVVYLSYGKMFLAQAMNLEFSNEERMEKLKKAEEKFREALNVHRGLHLAHSFLAITLKEQGKDVEAEKEFELAEWWAPFAEEKKMVFIKSIPSRLKLKNILDKYIIPNEIKDIFEAEGKTLSENASVKKETKIKNRWGIKDNESYYLIIEIRSNTARLNIYGNYHPGRLPSTIGKAYLTFNRYKEAMDWLEIAIREEPENFLDWWRLGYAKMKLAFDLEEIKSREETKYLLVGALSDLETAWEKAPKPLQLPASKDIPERIAKCKKHLYS